LNEFWRGAESFRPDAKLLRRFRAYTIEQTQLNGSFYAGPIDALPCAALLSVARQVRTCDAPTNADTGNGFATLPVDSAASRARDPLGLITLRS
jgi:hypothetical protein